MITVRQCRLADKEHRHSLRQYAHVHHVKDNVICIAEAWADLPISNMMGLIAHEVGHLLMGETDHSEDEADDAGNKFFRVKIKYRDDRYGDSLQYLSHYDMLRVYEWVLKNVKFVKFEGRLFA